MSIPEIERRQNHISGVDPNHPLLPIAIDCLKDADGERPSAQQLCERVAALKETAKYKNASERVNSGKDGEYEQLRHIIDQKDATISEREQQMRQCREELTQQIQEQNEQIWQQNQENQRLERDNCRLESERNQVIQEKGEKERQLGQVNQQLEESERLIAEFRKRNTNLEDQLSVLRNQAQEKDGGAKARAVDRTSFKLRWREGKKAPFEMHRSCDAVVGNNIVYCKYKNLVNAYHIPSSSWSPNPKWPSCNWNGFAITVIDGALTTVGGYRDSGKDTNKLLSLTREGTRWTEKFPPMPTNRYAVSVLCTGTALIVAGGAYDKVQPLKTVEVPNTETRQWQTAPDLPLPLSESSLTLCGDLIYLLGGYNEDGATNLVYSCLLSSLLSTPSKSLGERLASTLKRSSKRRIWNKVADLPVKDSTAVTLHGQLLAIGGEDSEDKPSTAVHMYQPTTDSWEVISHIATPRSGCLAAVLPDNQLMVVGGYTTGGKRCDSVEFGRII